MLIRNRFSLRCNMFTWQFRRVLLNFNTNNQWSAASLLTGNGADFNWHMEIPNTHWLHIGCIGNNVGGAFDDHTARGGPTLRVNSSVNGWVGWEADCRPWINPIVFTSAPRAMTRAPAAGGSRQVRRCGRLRASRR